jgi:hypothetical protein
VTGREFPTRGDPTAFCHTQSLWTNDAATPRLIMRGMTMEPRVLLARLRAAEEFFQGEIDHIQAISIGREEGDDDGRFLAGQVSAYLVAKARVKRLRDHLASVLAQEANLR